MYIVSKKYLRILQRKNWLIEKKLYLIKKIGLRLMNREKDIKNILIKKLDSSKINKIK
jgi:hypothetical protein